MKKLKYPLTFLLLLLFISGFSQALIDHPVVLTGSGSNAKLTGIQNVSSNKDATSVDYIQRDSLKFAISTGSNNAYLVNLSPAVTTQYTVGMVVLFKASFMNTGAATLNVNSLGAVNILKNYNGTLASGDIQNGQMVSVMYDGANFQMLSQLANSTTVTHGKLSFGYIGANQYFMVPAGITSINVKLWGAGGAGGSQNGNSTGGGGAFVSGTLSVAPGDSLTIIVGQGGFPYQNLTYYSGVGYYGGGGGAGYRSGGSVGGGGGGGRSAIQIISGTDAVTAGGGGGGGDNGTSYYGNGGGGGATTGANGIGGNSSSCTTTGPGSGATISAPGAGGSATSCSESGYNGSSGSQYQGGAGGGTPNPNRGGGGGGGGYYGGGGGEGYYGSGGGGGSSYPASGFTLSAGSTAAGGANTSNMPAAAGGTSDVDYQATIGYGGYFGNGGNGLVIISW